MASKKMNGPERLALVRWSPAAANQDSISGWVPRGPKSPTWGRIRKRWRRVSRPRAKEEPTRRPPGLSTRAASAIAASGAAKQCNPQKEKKRSTLVESSGSLVASACTNRELERPREAARRRGRRVIEGERATPP